jgi:iron(III) transport system permease protein
MTGRTPKRGADRTARSILAVAGRLTGWSAQRRASPLWTVAVALVLALMLLPIVTILTLAFTASDNVWPHLLRTVLPGSLWETAVLMSGVGVLTLVVGGGTAWIITMHRFPGREVLDRLLVIPLAVPTYIVAYCYVDLLDYGGPIQSTLRALFGWQSLRDYWFPEVRSMTGAIFVMSAVLYPYVYLAARASFVQQSVCALEVARTLGRTPLGAFISVGLPMARPALAAGTALTLMECLNDLGAVQHLGVSTLTLSIYTTWLQRSSLGGAAQIAGVLLLVVLLLFAIERMARGASQFHGMSRRHRAIPFADLEGWKAAAAAAVCFLPFACGFILPFLVLVAGGAKYLSQTAEPGFWRAAGNSMLLAALSAVAAVALSVLLGYARRVAANGFTRPAVRLAGLGYAMPGTVLALGILIPLALVDNSIDAFFRTQFGISTGLILTGSLFALVLACTVRFLAVSLGAVEAGLELISPNLDAAARTLGESPLSALWRVHVPLLIPALGTAGLLVFVDAMKELPTTLLLRPFNFETLATHVYSFALLEQFEAGSIGALAIVAVGLVPVLLLHQAVAGGRAGSRLRRPLIATDVR